MAVKPTRTVVIQNTTRGSRLSVSAVDEPVPGIGGLAPGEQMQLEVIEGLTYVFQFYPASKAARAPHSALKED